MQQEIEIKNLTEVAKTVLYLAEKIGASQADVTVESDEGLSVSVRLSELETLEFHQGKSVSVSLYLGKRCASASTTDLSKDSLKSMVQAAYDIAQFTEEDPCYGLAERELMATEYPDVEQYHPWKINGENVSSKILIDSAMAGDKKALGMDKRIVNSDGVAFNLQESHWIYANTNDFCGHFSETSYSSSCSLIAQDGKDMQRGSSYTVAHSADRLKSMDDVVSLAVSECIDQLNPQKVKTQRTSVVFDSAIASHLISAFIAAISGGNLYRQSSFLLNHLGKSIFPAWLSILEDPHQLNTIGAAPFDSEGLLTRKKYLVQEGMLETYLLGSYSARRLGLKTTANAGGVHNVLLASSNPAHLLADRQALLKKMDRGVLVTSLMGSSVSILTGDYSRGASGFWVENGEIQYPVNEFTIASNLKDMMMNIQSIASDIDDRKNIKIGSVLVSDMMVAGK